jgi:molybdate transport system permease protein
MLGGNIEGVTRTLSVSIYDDVQSLDYASANKTALAIMAISVALLGLMHWLGRGQRLREGL